jgi:Leucine-rich repeat (LRR) protein
LEGDALTDLPRLNVLHLQSNKLTKIYKEQFAGLTNVKEIHLEFNQISYIEPQTFDHLEDLHVLTLR